MRILLVAPEEMPEVREIDRTLSVMQELVGGTIQAVYPFDDPVALVCNDEGELLQLPGNRALRDGAGNIYDIVCGPFFLCGAPADCNHFTDLTEEQVEKYRRLFEVPEMFLCVNGQLVVLPML